MKKTYINICIVIMIVILSLTGCGTVQDKVSEKVGEKIAGDAIGGSVDITKDGLKAEKDGVSYQTGDDLKWSKEAMGNIPEPKAKISGVSNAQGEGGSVTYSEMSLEEAKAYEEKLIDLGYTEDGRSVADNDMMGYSGKNSSGDSVIFTYNIGSKDGSIYYIPSGAQ
ncbi:MAG: hypothetical protein GX434_13160 [Peptococcaceae bacterium]|nr:hypothetical protein [Peptococcaceae bacterium]